MLDILRKRIPDDLSKLKIAVVMGGSSDEKDFSYRSGTEVINACINLNLNCESIDLDENVLTNIQDKNIDLVFLATHGVPGEDGVIQGGLDQMGIAYTSAGVEGSVLAINKLVSKSFLSKCGIKTPAWEMIQAQDSIENTAQHLTKSLGFPMILKPTCGGSSIGVRLCLNVTELRTALELLLKEHSEIFAETFIKGRELTVSVLEDSRSKPYCLPVLEVALKNLFYDYESKWVDGIVDFHVPAKLDGSIESEIVEQSIKIHKLLKQRDVSRSDFILDANNALYYLETNSIPGLTQLSDLPAQARAHGMMFEEAVLAILLGALRRKNCDA